MNASLKLFISYIFTASSVLLYKTSSKKSFLRHIYRVQFWSYLLLKRPYLHPSISL